MPKTLQRIDTLSTKQQRVLTTALSFIEPLAIKLYNLHIKYFIPKTRDRRQERALHAVEVLLNGFEQIIIAGFPEMSTAISLNILSLQDDLDITSSDHTTPKIKIPKEQMPQEEIDSMLGRVTSDPDINTRYIAMLGALSVVAREQREIIVDDERSYKAQLSFLFKHTKGLICSIFPVFFIDETATIDQLSLKVVSVALANHPAIEDRHSELKGAFELAHIK